MNRRQFVSGMVASSTLARGWQAPRDQSSSEDSSVKSVLVLFKCHFDAGFVDTQANVVRKYFEVYFPEAMTIARASRREGERRYVWTTGSWLIYEYLEQATPKQRKMMEQALLEGDLAWHALPFSWQSELLNQSAIAGAIGLSKSLDRRFGRQTTGAKMTDVPGHSRGLIIPLAENGVTFLDIGVNAASTPPDVPSAFRWVEPAGASLNMLYHREYGGVVRLPGSDVVIDVEVRDDNSGPHTAEEIEKIYSKLRQKFPEASIRPANLTEIAQAVASHQTNLPVLNQEIGDTWIYGVPSDPVKVARYRELLRLRNEWIAQDKLKPADPVDLRFLSRFALAAEHTWGTDTKTWLDFEHYTPDSLAQMLSRPKYQTVTGSWAEKRKNIEDGVDRLPHHLRVEAHQRLATLKPSRPDVSGLAVHDASKALVTEHFTLALNPSTGAIGRLRSHAKGREWASEAHPFAQFFYQTLSKKDYDRFLASYITVQTDWAPKDFGKPNIEHFGAQSRAWSSRLIRCFSGETAEAYRLVAHLQVDPAAKSAVTAAPEELYLDLLLPKAEPVVNCHFSWFSKRANRMPEALWLSFNPIAPLFEGWSLSKIESTVSPFQVVPGGNRYMHAITDRVTYRDPGGSITFETLDAPVVAFGKLSPIYFSRVEPSLNEGLHFSLFNNGWGTNYIQWFGEDMRFRFEIRA